jgi:hypothetical protein
MHLGLIFVGILVALGGAYMAQGVWGVITALGFIILLGRIREEIAREVRAK